jgi:hypothetical protein
MKKIIIPGILGALCVLTPVFSESGRTLPARVFALEASARYTFANAYFDFGRQYARFLKNEGAFKSFNLGLSAAYGITHWLSAGIRWIPGRNLWSVTDRVQEPSRTVSLAGFYDILTEIKIQLIGQRGLIKKDRFRLTIAPQIKIPLPGPDYEKQRERMLRGESIVMENLDRHIWGLGAKIYLDFIITKSFYINLYGDGIFYPGMGKLSNAGLDEYLYSLGPNIARNSKVRYLGDLRFEVEPHFKQALTPKMTLTAGLPLNFTLDCGIWRYSSLPNRPERYRLSLRPNISFFFFTPPVPFEFEISYSIPLWGKDQKAAHSLAFLAKLYITGK